MPDRATILAATPKCPVEMTHVGGKRCCSTLLIYDGGTWRCPSHGPVLSESRLTTRQLLASA